MAGLQSKGIISEDSNETSVRFHVIDPLLRRLGYPDDERVYIEFEEKLEYPYVHIGHRSKKDLPLGLSNVSAYGSK